MANPQYNEHLARFWAKTTHDPVKYPRAYHPLLCHMIDVAVVTRQMWREALPHAGRESLVQILGLDADATEACVAWLAGLHDVGKASPPFALRELRGEAEHLRRLYDDTPFSYSANRVLVVEAKDAPHGIVTAWTLPPILQEFNFPRTLATQIATIIGGHHGVVPRSDEVNRMKHHAGGETWQQARRELARELARLLNVPVDVFTRLAPTLDNASAMWFAGLVSVADWIGSNQVYYPCKVSDAKERIDVDFEEYLAAAGKQAHQALRELGWINFAGASEPRTFEQLFPKLTALHRRRPLQDAAVRLADSLTSPGIVIIEAPMGEGKTEAAMYLADHWNVARAARGCYFALPTQATSNQMFGRVREFLAMRYENEVVGLQLLHGHASLSAEFQLLRADVDKILRSLKVSQIYAEQKRTGQQEQAEDHASVLAAEWFTYRKRGLLAPFGVGTIDQSLLAVLQTRHVFVRLFALAHKVVIIDEVHAYDAYMSALLERLLEWLAALGSPVILLSATLPHKRCRDLLNAYRKGLKAGTETNAAATTTDIVSAEYPRLSWATSSHVAAQHIETSAQNSRALDVQWVAEPDAGLGNGESELGMRLRTVLTDGGCVAIICNTVRRAQEIYRQLQLSFSSEMDEIRPEFDLLHARFLFRERAARERRTLAHFGKPDTRVDDDDGEAIKVFRPHCAVLVSTQIIEQSLDIDFDLMISELAPIDLLLQRAGRLHRHQREAPRPSKLKQPALWIIESALDENGLPDFGASAKVYAPHILLRTWLELRSRQDGEHISIRIPADVEGLIESVYDEARACPVDVSAIFRSFWAETQLQLEAARLDEQSEAEDRWIKRPSYSGSIWRLAQEPRAEDTPELHTAHQALTRLMEPTVQVICLYGTEECPYLDADMQKVAEVNCTPSLAQAKELLLRSMSVANKEVVFTLLAMEVPEGWRKSPLLRNHRLILLDTSSSTDIGAYRFHLHPELGLRIIRREREVAYA